MNKSSNGFVPDAHQFLPMDMLESGWLAGFGVHGGQGLPRSRILIADEGGTGKTLSASLAVRYASLISPMDGPIVCLVPPLLIDHWVNHLKQVFNDEPERVVGLNSASHFGNIITIELLLSQNGLGRFISKNQIFSNCTCLCRR